MTMTFMEALMISKYFDALFDQFMHECKFESISKAAGLKMKSTTSAIALLVVAAEEQRYARRV